MSSTKENAQNLLEIAKTLPADEQAAIGKLAQRVIHMVGHHPHKELVVALVLAEIALDAERKPTRLSLTTEQLQSWRHMLITFVGPYALMMPDTQVEEMAGIFQDRISKGE